MAKKAAKAPEVKCQNADCNQSMHPRTKLCPKCGVEQKRGSGTKKAVKAAGKKPGRKPKAPAPVAGAVSDVAVFALKHGGIDGARKALDDLEKQIGG